MKQIRCLFYWHTKWILEIRKTGNICGKAFSIKESLILIYLCKIACKEIHVNLRILFVAEPLVIRFHPVTMKALIPKTTQILRQSFSESR